MTIPKARPPHDPGEYASIANLIQRVFGEDSTTQAHRSLLKATTFAPGSLPAIWNDDGEALAVVQAAPCEIALMDSWVPGGIITMVATDEAARGQGYMRACMEAGHQWLRDTGRPVGILFGVPAIYPRFAYRPVMARSETRYPLLEGTGVSQLRDATSADISAMTALFNRSEVTRSCSIRRAAEEWVWSGPDASLSVAVLDGDVGIAGFARYSVQNGAELDVFEAITVAGAEAEMLDALHACAADRACREVVLRLMPDHPLVHEVNRRATGLELFNVQTSVWPPQAGMLCVLDAEALLATLRPTIEQRLPASGLRLTTSDGLDVTFGDGHSSVHLPDPADLAHLLSGHPGVAALRQWHKLRANAAALRVADTTFPTGWPRWTYAPFWGEH